MEAYAATDRLMTEAFHCPAQRYDGDAVLELEPALKPGLAGGWYYHDDAHLRPDKLMRSWREVLGSRRCDDPRELRLPRLSPPERPCRRRRHRQEGASRRRFRRRHRRLDAAAESTSSAAACRSSRARATA